MVLIILYYNRLRQVGAKYTYLREYIVSHNDQLSPIEQKESVENHHTKYRT